MKKLLKYLFTKNETYVTFVINVFIVILLVSAFFRYTKEKSGMSFAVFFDDDPRILLYESPSDIPEEVELVVPINLSNNSTLNENIDDFIKKLGNRGLGLAEFYGNTDFVKKVYDKTKAERIYRVHYVKPQEVEKLSENLLFKRLRRAVIERSIDVIILPRNEKTENILSELRRFLYIEQDLPNIYNPEFPNKIFGIMLGIYVSLFMPSAVLLFILYNKFYWLFVTLLSITGTIAVFYAVRNKYSKPFGFYVLGLLTNFSLYSFEYVNGLKDYFGVKLSLLTLPVLVIAIIVIQNWKYIKSKLVFLLPFAGAFLLYYILRSGNYGYVIEFEEKIRLMLENIFIIRPRIKELIFLPLFFIASDFQDSKFAQLLIAFSSVGFVSIFNSFCHIRTPLFVTMYREIVTILVAIVIYYVFQIIYALIQSWKS